MRRLFVCLAGLGLLGGATQAAATQFFVGVHPNTGASTIFVGAGVAQPPGNEGASPSAPILPSQQISNDPGLMPPGSLALDPETTAGLIAQSLADSPVIQHLLRNSSAIQEENQQFLAELAAAIDQNLEGTADPDSLDEYQQNIASLINQLVREAADQVSLTEDELNALRARATPVSVPDLEERQQAEQRQQEREQRQQQAQQAREQQAQQARDQQQQARERNQALIAKVEEQKRQLEEANRHAAEEQRRKAEEALRQRQNAGQQESASQDQDRARQASARQKGADDAAQRLRERALAGRASPSLNPSAPVTPESLQNHVNGMSGTGGNAVAGRAGTEAGGSSASAGESALTDGGDVIAGTSNAGESPGDVHTDYASQEQRNSAVESAADDYLASEPEPTPGVDQDALWASFLANNDGPLTEEAPTQSIYGEMVGVYKGLVRGSFEDGPSANGTIQMNISFTDAQAVGSIHFDDNQGTLQLNGSLGYLQFETSMEGNAFGGSASGNLNGYMYGPNGEEIGGNWSMSVFDGVSAERSASGNFAAKQ